MAGSSQSNEVDAGTLAIIGIFVIIGGSWLLSVISGQYVHVWRGLRIGELHLLAWLPSAIIDADIPAALAWLQKTPAEAISKAQMAYVDGKVGLIYKVGATLIIAPLLYKSFGLQGMLRRSFSLETLLHLYAKRVPFLQSFVGHHPEKAPTDTGPDATSLTPFEFAEAEPPVGMKKGTAPILRDNFFNHELARQVFDKQLGKPLCAPEQMSEAERRIHDFILSKMKPRKIDGKLIQPGQLAEMVMSRHGFVRTALMSLLEEARGGGVVACLEFGWLKYEDRTLWYALQSVGRKVAFTEAAGAFAHWLLEKELGRAVPTPETSEAVQALYSACGMEQNY